ncbi:MAG: DUF4139 domain-containing protein [Solobacterium sp.]|nr:DUF4139 domain-containing protein [Solobacterium sp.]
MIIKTKITEASVYHAGCTVKKTASVRLQKGAQRVSVEGIRPGIDERTIRILLTNGCTCGNVRAVYPSAEDGKKKEITDRIGRLKMKRANKVFQQTLLRSKEVYSSREGLENKMQIIMGIDARMDEIDEELLKLDEQIAELEEELQEQEQAPVPVEADLYAPCDTETQITLEYFDDCASWNAANEIHASAKDGNIRFISKARITQDTQEDWQDVKLSLLSSVPGAWHEIPAFRTSYVSIREEMTANLRPSMPAPKMMMMDSMSMNATVAAGAAMSAVPTSVRVDNETAAHYEMEGLHTVKKDETISLIVSDDVIEAEFEDILMPHASDTAYLSARVSSEDIPDGMGGMTAAYLEGVYIGMIGIEKDDIEEKTVISLGEDESLKLKTEKKVFNSASLLKNRKKSVTNSYTLRNEKGHPVSVLLIDRVPVSSSKQITIESAECAKGGFNDRTGRLERRFTMEPKQQLQMTFSYEISWPKDKKISEY